MLFMDFFFKNAVLSRNNNCFSAHDLQNIIDSIEMIFSLNKKNEDNIKKCEVWAPEIEYGETMQIS